LQRSESLNKKKQFDLNGMAGKQNSYKETEFRYANILPESDPSQSAQFYGSKALKNLSALKLY